MPLFRIENNKTVQLKASEFSSEKELQTFFENNLMNLLGVKFIASEFLTGDRQRGRIDTLGLDQNGSPTIIEYKKRSNDTVINQGFYYLEWLLDHKAEFILAAQKKLIHENEIDWSNPKLIFIAEGYSEYDTYGVKRMGGNVDIWEYHLYDSGSIYLNLLYSSLLLNSKNRNINKSQDMHEKSFQYSVETHLQRGTEKIVRIFNMIRDCILSIDEEGLIIENPTKVYIGYKHGKNFCEISIFKEYLRMWLDINKNELNDPKNISTDVTHKGHHGTGSTEIRVTDTTDITDVMNLVIQSYKNTL